MNGEKQIIMKRSHSSDDERDAKRDTRTTATTSTSTPNTTTAHTNRLSKYGTHLKHQLNLRGAASASKYIKSDWTSEQLDLTKTVLPLSALAHQHINFIDQLFSIFSEQELKSFTPDILKDISISELKELCLEELKSIPIEKIKFICDGNKAEDFEKLNALNTSGNDNKLMIGNNAHKSDDIQLTVDDNEYSDFLGKEKAGNKVLMKDVEIQANESSLESSSEDESISDDNKEGWMNIFAKNQMEILELEMRARAIRSLMKAQDYDHIEDNVKEHQINNISNTELFAPNMNNPENIDIIHEISDIQTQNQANYSTVASDVNLEVGETANIEETFCCFRIN